jgi:metal-dependent amidase/aminoacylase/carboxypeptidase family protein
MAYYLQEVPGCFFFLGAYNEDVQACFSHHHPRFTVDEEALPIGVELFLTCVDRLADHFAAR